ncbi:hypothetical protein TNCV_4737031 [Trichonephila clavipes]|nr:hypothetical protein TNCV_4737031 [Trichonephila clavipes]
MYIKTTDVIQMSALPIYFRASIGRRLFNCQRHQLQIKLTNSSLIMKLLYLAIALMCLLINLNTSTHAAEEGKEGEGGKGEEKSHDHLPIENKWSKGSERLGHHRSPASITRKGKCPAIPPTKCHSFEAQCCKTKECETGEICCQTACKFECLKQKEIKGSMKTPEINLSKEKCKEYNKTESFVTTNPSVTRN